MRCQLILLASILELILITFVTEIDSIFLPGAATAGAMMPIFTLLKVALIGAGAGVATGLLLRPALGKRSVDQPELLMAPSKMSNKNLQSIFDAIAKLDQQLCVPRLICEVHATYATTGKTNFRDEELIVGLFRKYKTADTPGTVSSLYREAAMLGSSRKSSQVCQNFFSSCQIPSENLHKMFRETSVS